MKTLKEVLDKKTVTYLTGDFIPRKDVDKILLKALKAQRKKDYYNWHCWSQEEDLLLITEIEE